MNWPRTEHDIADARFILTEALRYPAWVRAFAGGEICGCGDVLEGEERQDGTCEACLTTGVRTKRWEGDGCQTQRRLPGMA